MKKKIAVLCVLLICLCFAACACAPGSGNDCLRIHIRANSNSQTDQKVKYLVKDAVVEYLTPLLASADTKDKAKAVVLSARDGIEAAAERVLAENSFRYGAEAELTTEVFPARTYGPLTLGQRRVRGADSQSRQRERRQLVVCGLSAAVFRGR